MSKHKRQSENSSKRMERGSAIPNAIGSVDEFRQALALHQKGHIRQAERMYRKILSTNPHHHESLHYLGVTAIQTADYASAIRLIGESIDIEPSVALVHANRGRAYLESKEFEAAIASFDCALKLDPQFANAYYNRANALRELGRFDDAIADYERATLIQPVFPDAYNNRGLTLYKSGRLVEAVASYDQALRHSPDMIGAWNNRGNALRELKKSREALASFDRALHIKPNFAEAHNNRGMVFRDLWVLDEALQCYDRALHIKPDYVEALNNRGNTLMDLKRPEEAAATYDRVFQLAPQMDYALGGVFGARLLCCDWSDYDRLAEEVATDIRTGRRLVAPFTSLCISAGDAEELHLQCARAYVRSLFASVPVWHGAHYQHERIRIAYLSADFHNHATAYLATGLFERHDRQKFETVAVSFGPDNNTLMRQRLSRAFDRFVDVRSQNDRDVAQMLRDMQIDIAIDLKGFTAEHRLGILMHRAAPIQVNYLGFPGTMGVDCIDYILADGCVIPPENAAHYSERVVYMPNCYQPNDCTRKIADRTPTRMEIGLPASGFVFCCFNGNYKITPSTFDVWMRLLGQVPGSVFWLLEGSAAATRNLRREASSRGIDPARLIFAPLAEQAEHLARIQLADLFLDTLPINAHTTASDALWAGVPVLTCKGDTFAGRVAASVLQAVGLPELIADTLEAYEEMALRLALTPQLLRDVRAKLARNRDIEPLFNTELYCRNLEAAYLEMCQRYQRGEAPGSFAVPIR